MCVCACVWHRDWRVEPISEAYRKAHARDGINEMHPEILNRRISSQETGEMETSRVSHPENRLNRGGGREREGER